MVREEEWEEEDTTTRGGSWRELDPEPAFSHVSLTIVLVSTYTDISTLHVKTRRSPVVSCEVGPGSLSVVTMGGGTDSYTVHTLIYKVDV